MVGVVLTKRPGAVLLGRRSESEVLDELLQAVRGGQSQVLVVLGEAGIGKTALLEHAIASAAGFRVARVAGVESEMDLPFAGLQQLCASMLDRLERLPDPQRDALGVAFGRRSGHPPDRFLIGLAVLSLLSEAAEHEPVLCLVDDAQWLDRATAQALAFVARRLLAESVALVFAARERSHDLRGLPELVVRGLQDGDARTLLDSVLPGAWDARVRERVVAEARGNPLALLELPRASTPGEWAGGFGLPVGPAPSERIEESFQRRVPALPQQTRLLLLVAAAEPVGDPALVWGAAERLGLGASAADAAESEGLLEIGAAVTFRHPLVRSTAYRSASPEERRAVHGALAQATDARIDPDRRAWHRAQAAPGPDEDVAGELDASADRAQARGGPAAAGAFLERASALTLDPGRRAARTLAAAEAKYQAGALDPALRLVNAAVTGPLDEDQCARADVLRGRIMFASNRGSDAATLLLKAARRLEPLDATLARDIYLDALTAALFAGRLAGGAAARAVAEAAHAASTSSAQPRASDFLLDGLAMLITEGPAAGAPTLRRALDAFAGDQAATEERLRWLWLAGRAAGFIWDYRSWDALTARQVQLARDAGALTVLPLTLSTRAGVHLFAGELSTAAALIEEGDAVTEATGGRVVPYGPLALAAFRGREADATDRIEAALDDFLARGEGMGVSLAEWAKAALYNGLGRYEHALAAAERALEDPKELWFYTWASVELIEAAARSGKSERATDALERLAEMTRASGTDWVHSIEARSRALLNRGAAAEALYREAIERLVPTPLRLDLARARLLYGEWLRRERRRLEAREQLRTAYELFAEFGMEGFAERARLELKATGEHARKRTVETRDALTPREAQITRLAAEGATNQEIAARLFISPSTVDYHLRKVFRKLDVKSRTELARHVLQPSARPAPVDRA
jgi:DNA-binding CsgD family transcriptional regulator